MLAALSDGEDFELLFTVASGDAVALLDGWKKEFLSDRGMTLIRKDNIIVVYEDKRTIRPKIKLVKVEVLEGLVLA